MARTAAHSFPHHPLPIVTHAPLIKHPAYAHAPCNGSAPLMRRLDTTQTRLRTALTEARARGTWAWGNRGGRPPLPSGWHPSAAGTPIIASAICPHRGAQASGTVAPRPPTQDTRPRACSVLLSRPISRCALALEPRHRKFKRGTHVVRDFRVINDRSDGDVFNTASRLPRGRDERHTSKPAQYCVSYRTGWRGVSGGT